jgi:hypothetical protein
VKVRTRVTEEASYPLVLDQRHALPAHAGGRDCTLHHPLGTGRLVGMLRRAARCTKYGKGGVDLQHPSWGGPTPAGRQCRSARWRRCRRLTESISAAQHQRNREHDGATASER